MREPLKCWTKKIPVVNISLYAFSGPIYTTDAMMLGKPSSLEPVFAPVLGVPVQMEQKLWVFTWKCCCVNGVSLLLYHVEAVFSVLATGLDQSCGAGGFPPRMPWRWWVFNLLHPRRAGPATLLPNHWPQDEFILRTNYTFQVSLYWTNFLVLLCHGCFYHWLVKPSWMMSYINL